MRTVVKTIDSISEWAGKTIRWLCVVLVVVMVYEVIMRYGFGAPTMWAYETCIMLGAAIYGIAWSYTHRHNAHIRVDVFYMRLSPKGKAIVDVAGDLLFLFPLAIILIGISSAWTWRAWLTNEVMAETYWYPPSAPLRTVVTLGFCLFALQGVANFTRNLSLLIRSKPL